MKLLKDAPDSYKRLFTSIKRKAKRCKVKLRFSLAPVVSYNDEDLEGMAGYFLDDEKEVAVATQGYTARQFMKTLIHESCHMDQFFDRKIGREKNNEWGCAYEIVNRWMHEGKEYSEREIDNAFRLVIECEKDCEQRSVAKIIKYGLDKEAGEFRMSVDTYTRQANTYLYTYLIERENRMVIQVTHLHEVYKKAPKVFQEDYNEVPPRMRKAIEQYLRWQQKQLIA